MLITEDLKFSSKEKEEILYNSENIPDNILDIHTHVFLQQHFSNDRKEEILSTLIYNQFSFNDLNVVNSMLFPNKEVENIVFGYPHPDINIQDNNAYISSQTLNSFFLGDKHYMTYCKQELDFGSRRGIKMYPSKGGSSILDIFPEEILEKANELCLPIMLHLPNNIIDDLGEIILLSKRFSNISFILAHGGVVQKCQKRVNEYQLSITKIKDIENIYIDTSGINQPLFLSILLRSFNKKRILYGGDLPTSLIRGLTLPGKGGSMRIITKKEYPGQDFGFNNQMIKNLGINLDRVINIHQENIKLLIQNLSSQEKDDIFYLNAKRLLKM